MGSDLVNPQDTLKVSTHIQRAMSSKKVPEVVFEAAASDGKLFFSNTTDLEKYCIEHDSEVLFVHIEPVAQLSEKAKMYAYYHRVILKCAVIGYTAAGYEGLDDVTTDYKMRAEFAKTFIKNPKGDWEPIIIDKRNMTKARLHKYLSDCILFIELTLQVMVPDSEEWKLKKETGIEFKKIE